ncbi:uncharacterized protein LOC110978584 [Acanthaster planci]|uniref:Uncharacterized protein LOC110978584 n=1 Tax=Acanthaster planci TaxID=133434 RepID=A0A8B7YAI1_ACAPL|nr:uncharacterized protein LOC110978584 [Acanthaster planci]XP_022089389.1 uncharacterized protein LOC110978584 [Acanthaster planci]XP_022089390.1 uncharacterized protein LOC110978584 [Acanthaster planci]XP_022089391.1 uncharacterized protein LOC110978584 [Acanthaster planci]
MAAMNERLRHAQTWLQSMMEYLHVKERSAAAIIFAKQRPIAATLIGVAVATSFLPAVAFVSFVATFLIIGVIALLVIEGTAILSAIVILLLALVGCMMATVFIGAVILGGLFAGRFTWRIAAPLRTKMAVRLGMHGSAADNKTAPSATEEKGQLETDYMPDLGFAGKGTEAKSD